MCVHPRFSGVVTYNFQQNLRGPRPPKTLGSTVPLHLVMKAYVNEIPVLEPRRLQDGAEVAVELITSNQVVVCRPASATKNGDN